MKTRASELTLVALVLASSGALGQDAVAPDEFARAAESLDPMELALAVDEMGQAALLEQLTSDDRALRLAAIVACPQLPAPELALAPLGLIAAGRDPELAPAAAREAVTIARGLDGGALARREVRPEELEEGGAAFAALAADESARGDLRAAATVIVAQLEVLSAP